MKKKATKAQEIAIITKVLAEENNTIYSARVSIKVLLTNANLHSPRINKFAKDRHPQLWEWQEFAVTLQLGWRRYFAGCSNKESIFVKIATVELRAVKNCTCCLYWRGVAWTITVAVISYLSGKYLS